MGKYEELVSLRDFYSCYCICFLLRFSIRRTFETKYLRMDQVKLVEFWLFKFLGCIPQLLPGSFLKTLFQIFYITYGKLQCDI